MNNAYLDKYCACMEEIKKRAEVVDAFVTGRCNAVYPQTTAESVFLQMRKILELIALASLVANTQKYRESRSCFAKDWNARKIMSRIKSFNPDFYPVPTRQVVDPATGKVIETKEIESGFLTKTELERTYDRCSHFLHSENPFARPRDTIAFLADIPRLMERTRNLLNHHHVQLVDESLQLWVIMNAETDGRVHVYLFERIDTADDNVNPYPGRSREEGAPIVANHEAGTSRCSQT